MKNSEPKIVLIKDKEWSVIDGEPCRVTDFATLGSFVDTNDKVSSFNKTIPYACITFDCKKLGSNVRGYITHKVDFKHLWAAFKERQLKEDEEVIVFWTKKHYKARSWIGKKLYSAFMPKLWVIIYPKGAYELMVYPELVAKTPRWYDTMKIIIDWKPEVME
ncbi:hypothetical protein ACFLVH_01945 [Chloroflexota bacterium]